MELDPSSLWDMHCLGSALFGAGQIFCFPSSDVISRDRKVDHSCVGLVRLFANLSLGLSVSDAIRGYLGDLERSLHSEKVRDGDGAVASVPKFWYHIILQFKTFSLTPRHTILPFKAGDRLCSSHSGKGIYGKPTVS